MQFFWWIISKILVPSKTKDIKVKVFYMIASKNKAKTKVKHISCYWKCKFDSITCNWNHKLNNETYQCKSKNYQTCKKYYIWKPTICICENRKYLKSHVDDLKIMCEKTICYLLLYVYMLLHCINKCYKYCSKKTQQLLCQ